MGLTLGYYLVLGELDFAATTAGDFITYGLSKNNVSPDSNYSCFDTFTSSERIYRSFSFYINNEITRSWYFMFRTFLETVDVAKAKATFIRIA